MQKRRMKYENRWRGAVKSHDHISFSIFWVGVKLIWVNGIMDHGSWTMERSSKRRDFGGPRSGQCTFRKKKKQLEHVVVYE